MKDNGAITKHMCALLDAYDASIYLDGEGSKSRILVQL